MLADLVARLYGARPAGTLFHYTSLRGLTGILECGSLWASELHHLNDAEELRHFGGWIHRVIAQRLAGAEYAEILKQFDSWLSERLTGGPLVFAASFTENGNLLSQWRGYCPHGQGVSIGFDAARLAGLSQDQSFVIGRCVYDQASQEQLANHVVDAVVIACNAAVPEDLSKRHPSQSYFGVFQNLEPDILRISALIKNRSFDEEVEWRILSPIFSNYVEPPIKYRVGASMLIPYLEFRLPAHANGRMEVDSVIIGPTPTMNLSMRSLGQYLARHVHRVSLHNCQIPYRA